MTRRQIPVTALLDVGGGDELGSPDAAIARCETCDALYRARNDHDCPEGVA